MAVMVGLWQKFLITIIQVNLCPHPSFTRNLHKVHLNCKFFAIDRPSRPFLGRHLDFTTFSPCAGLPDLAAPFFYSLNGCDFNSLFNFSVFASFCTLQKRKYKDCTIFGIIWPPQGSYYFHR